ncbi:helix-turn-helix domain-containing protein [Streptomyces europaeiscabiei]|uniref:Helix-turn-helix transcriptional regulator n=1 Tax=Streptomyces europaeiscabiei TaxID=146819 RepID=A0ABU4NS55_9ACTN|nr:helix-turn-helix transcriptional regulator [Streptomyces europaeiscabiei]MDX3555165.1 helix-turn-helix transcriptional regulator [Streptomyces europaeiscabiei]MDX3705179.1 helix-turn-helix transcriptional regulator [Streptomyces europaeiscabiei]MDX3864410.1 helix-turn-helix transcriptional regulator [Streptomyces europaeiscabiei]MDX3871508.1 helix-turn-helix transcriptional regulator [Streptomyces europaeiscabiei]
MAQASSNTRLKSARIAAGYNSQQALADALSVGVRQVRRWESSAPPWPQGEMAQNLTRLLGQDLQSLGFTPPAGAQADNGRRPGLATAAAIGLAAVPTQAVIIQPASVAADFAAVTRAHRRLYWSVAPATLHPAAIAHATLGCALLPETAGQTRRAVAAALAETWLLAGRIEFFDLRDADRAQQTLLRALQAAGEADDPLIGSAILAHTAFIPAWAGERDAAVERMVAARTYARRGLAPAELLAWLDAVEAECETRCGHTRTALHLIGHAEGVLAEGNMHAVPEWLDWFSPVRLAAFKGNTQLLANHLPQARTTLLGVLDELEKTEEKQSTVVLGDLAAVEAAAGDPEAACGYARRALDQLERTWYAMGMDRVRDVRRSLTPHQHEACVRDLDDRLYGWATTVSALAR